MLNRISIVSKNQYYQSLLKVTSSKFYGKINSRKFTTTDSNPQEELPQEKKLFNGELKQTQLEQKEEDYNLSEVHGEGNKKGTSERSERPERPARQPQQFQKRDGPKLFKGGEREQNSSKSGAGLDFKNREEQIIDFETFKKSKAYQVHSDLIKLVQEKVSLDDTLKRKYLRDKLKELEHEPIKMIDKFTYDQLIAVVNKQDFDEKKEFDQDNQYQEQDSGSKGLRNINQDYYPAQEIDSLKKPSMNYDDYLSLLEDQAELQIQDYLYFGGDMKIGEVEQYRRPQESEDGSFYEDSEVKEIRLDSHPYDFMIWELKQANKFIMQDKQDPFDINRISQEGDNFIEKYTKEQEFKEQKRMASYDEDNLVEDYETEKRDVENQYLKIPQEEEEEFERTWSDVTREIYFGLKDDLKSEFDQVKTYMKLNQILRSKLASNVKSMRQMLQMAQRQRDKYYQRLESVSRDIQYDIQPNKAFDFIKQEKLISSQFKNLKKRQDDQKQKQVECARFKQLLQQAFVSKDPVQQISNLNLIIDEIQQSQSNREYLHSEVFLNQEFEVQRLFLTLVDKVGSRSLIDGKTKEDAMWKIIDYFTRMGYQNSLYTVIREQDIALYFKNHQNDSKTFDRVTALILRSKNASQLHNYIQQSLKEHLSLNKILPFSFDQSKIRNTYLRLKKASSTQEYQLNERVAEYLLFLMRSSKMYPEIIDLCSNYSELIQTSTQDTSEIRNYYLSDSLLQMPLASQEHHYYDLLEKVVFNKDSQQAQITPCYVTQMTKAYLKDGNVDHALKFFEEGIQKLRDTKNVREDFLVSVYDSVYGQKEQDLSFEDFKQKYLKSIQLSNQSLKEGFVVQQLSRVIEGKDYNQIEALFSLHSVLKEERQILQSLKQYNDQLYGVLLNTHVDEIENLNKEQRQRLSDIRLRKLALQSQLNQGDSEALIEIQNVIKDKQIKIFEGIKVQQADEIQKMFNLLSSEQIENILHKTNYLQNAIYKISDESSGPLKEFQEQAYANIEKTLNENIEQMLQERQYPDQYTPKAIQMMKSKKGGPPQHEMGGVQTEVEMYNFMYLNSETLNDEDDPVTLMAETHDQTMLAMKEQLLEAVNKRKQNILPIALKIFNKVQEKEIKSIKLDDIESYNSKDHGDNLYGNIDEVLQKYDLLLNNPRSPIYSALETLAQYKGDRGLTNFNKYYRDAIDMIQKRLDYKGIQKENKQLQALTDELQKNQATLKRINQILLKEQQEIGTGSSNSVFDKTADKWKNIKTQEYSDKLDKRARQLYQEFKDGKTNLPKNDEVNREQKLSLMRDALFFEYGQSFTSNENVFPSFFSQDLIAFGLENNVPEAIRLGEKMMSQTGNTLSKDMAMAVKNYLLDYQNEYNQAVKKTGPIDNTSLYKGMAQRMSQKDGAQNTPIFNLDDPYWVEFMDTHKGRQHMWKLPSHLAWDHKPRGIIDEVIDFKKLEANAKQALNYL